MTKTLPQPPLCVSVEIWVCALCSGSSSDIGGVGVVIENLQLVAQIALSYLQSQEITHRWQILFMRRLTFVSSFGYSLIREYVAVSTKVSGFLFFFFHQKWTAWWTDFQALSQNYEKRPCASSCVSVCPSSWNVWVPIGRIFMKFGIGGFLKICRENSSFIKIWQEWRELVKLNVHFDHISVSFRQKS
jgi:hypothetical protein